MSLILISVFVQNDVEVIQVKPQIMSRVTYGCAALASFDYSIS
jgi:hypothetical protein